ncbi:hypothetical protein [Nostoc sp. NMS4]|uniref:hypothetical protein n=1 Tax=Nostoc sp. NMS4 TaxID=2815390 RepID=UPI0025CD2B73|nr:hypothetical protein [Nostoc sp. NMS4]MBN3923021.1 hypothetical protein [Nostoc sp. NMS4]
MSQTTTVRRELYDIYESNIESARIQFEQKSNFEEILSLDIDPTVLELYLINFNSLGVAMTDSVEDWISRAGESCKKLGFTELGELLSTHAEQEAGHHLMMIQDTHTLVNNWNARRQPQLDAEWFLAQPISENVVLYRQLHEDVIASQTPFAQVAIEYEIEMLSVRYGSQLIQQCQKILGSQVHEGLSFMEEHVSVDVGHTQLNARLLKNFLQNNPEHLDAMVKIGRTALDAYAGFLNDCLTRAKEYAKTLG